MVWVPPLKPPDFEQATLVLLVTTSTDGLTSFVSQWDLGNPSGHQIQQHSFKAAGVTYSRFVIRHFPRPKPGTQCHTSATSLRKQKSKLPCKRPQTRGSAQGPFSPSVATGALCHPWSSNVFRRPLVSSPELRAYKSESSLIEQ